MLDTRRVVETKDDTGLGRYSEMFRDYTRRRCRGSQRSLLLTVRSSPLHLVRRVILSLSVSTRIPGETGRTRKRENGTGTARNRTYRVEGGAEGDSGGGGGGGARGGGERNTRDRQHSFVFSSARFGSTSYRISVFRGKPFFKFVAADLLLSDPIVLRRAGEERRSSGRERKREKEREREREGRGKGRKEGKRERERERGGERERERTGVKNRSASTTHGARRRDRSFPTVFTDRCSPLLAKFLEWCVVRNVADVHTRRDHGTDASSDSGDRAVPSGHQLARPSRAQGSQHRALPRQAQLVQDDPDKASGRVATVLFAGVGQQRLRGSLFLLHGASQRALRTRRLDQTLLRLLSAPGQRVAHGHAGLQRRAEQSHHHAEEGADHHELFLQLVHGDLQDQAGLQHSASVVDRGESGQERERGSRDSGSAVKPEPQLLQEHHQRRCPG